MKKTKYDFFAHTSNARGFHAPRGGAFGGNCSGPTPTPELPCSRIRVEIPLVQYEMAVSAGRTLDRGLIPDPEVSSTVQDIVAGRDAELEAAGRMLSEPGATETIHERTGRRADFKLADRAS